jgi:predicted transcriptional regulator
MQVSHVMRRDVVTITADQTLQNAAATMRLFDVGVLSISMSRSAAGCGPSWLKQTT